MYCKQKTENKKRKQKRKDNKKMRFTIKNHEYYDYETKLTETEVLQILNHYHKTIQTMGKELYCKDRILEDHNIPITICDK